MQAGQQGTRSLLHVRCGDRQPESEPGGHMTEPDLHYPNLSKDSFQVHTLTCLSGSHALSGLPSLCASQARCAAGEYQ